MSQSHIWHTGYSIISIVGTFVLIVLSLCWYAFARRCSRTAKMAHHANNVDTSEQLPSLTVITPIKGVHPDSMSNWRSVVATEYNGPVRFIFVVESDQDVAYPPLKQLQQEVQSASQKRTRHPVTVSVAVAGLSFHCSQKIHNMLEGVSAVDASSKYVLFLDDDVGLYRNTFRDLVTEAETDPKVFAVTGFPYDWVSTSSVPFPCYLKLVYRWTSLLFLWQRRPPVVWGGCMLIRREDLHSNRYNLMEAWRSFGYSDDMIVGSVCVREGRTVAMPATCIFPHKLGAHDSFATYWNFACRQMFVLDTYHCATERAQNYLLLFVVSLSLPTICVIGFILSMVRSASLAQTLRQPLASLARVYVLGSGLGLEFSSGVVSDTGGAANVMGEIDAFALTSLALSWLSYVCVGLSIRATIVQAIAVINSQQARKSQLPVVFPSLWRCIAAFVIHHIVLPMAAVFGYVSDTVTWSGVAYTVNNGRIVRVHRNVASSVGGGNGGKGKDNAQRNILTMDALQSLSIAKQKHAQRNFLVESRGAGGVGAK